MGLCNRILGSLFRPFSGSGLTTRISGDLETKTKFQDQVYSIKNPVLLIELFPKEMPYYMYIHII